MGWKWEKEGGTKGKRKRKGREKGKERKRKKSLLCRVETNNNKPKKPTINNKISLFPRSTLVHPGLCQSRAVLLEALLGLVNVPILKDLSEKSPSLGRVQ